MRYLGCIGINRGAQETSPGVLEQVIDEVEVMGEIRQPRMTWPQAGQRDGIKAAHILSMIIPEDSVIDYTEAVYVEWEGRKWAVTQFQIKRPRVELSLGGLYDE